MSSQRIASRIARLSRSSTIPVVSARTTPFLCQYQIARPQLTASIPCLRLPSRRFESTSSAPAKQYTFEQIQDLCSTSGHISEVTIIDVREPSELQSTGKIPGSINIPVGSNPDAYFLSEEEFEDRFGFAKPDMEGDVVFYCKAGVRSRAAAKLAEQAGFRRVGEYSGSWLDWEGKGGEVEQV